MAPVTVARPMARYKVQSKSLLVGSPLRLQHLGKRYSGFSAQGAVASLTLARVPIPSLACGLTPHGDRRAYAPGKNLT
jgi:hypothetical protein